jgi:cold shock CspA family protein
MIGQVKLVSYEKGYGFITVRNQPHDIYFKTRDVTANRRLRVGDQVEVEAYRSGPNKVLASKVVLQSAPDPKSSRSSAPVRQQRDQRPYYGRPTHVKAPGTVASGAAMGMLVGAMLGPVGAIVGGLIGACTGDRTKLLTQVCLKCGGTGHVTAITSSHIGYQCAHCHSFWKGRNKDNVTAAEPRSISNGRS